MKEEKEQIKEEDLENVTGGIEGASVYATRKEKIFEKGVIIVNANQTEALQNKHNVLEEDRDYYLERKI